MADGLKREAGDARGHTTRWGARLRAMRRQKGLSQVQLAAKLGVSPSYLNLIESDKRPLPAALLLKLATEVGVDLAVFARDDDAQLERDLQEAFNDPLFEATPLPKTDVRDLVSTLPGVAQAVRALYDAYQGARASTDALAERLHQVDPTSGVELSRSPSEDVNDYIQARSNHFAPLETAAEALWSAARLDPEDLYRGLVQHLSRAHGVTVEVTRGPEARTTFRRFDPGTRTLHLSELLPTRSRTFQAAHQIGLLEASRQLETLTDDPALSTDEARALCRVALANYFAGAVLMPYRSFLEAAEQERYDIDVVGRRFRVGFEQVAHRYTTLQRPGAEGVPFHMIRIDVAGNISKRFSGSGIRFARFSGACPRWNVFAAFLTPGRVVVQMSEMPDGQRYFCLARTIQKDSAAWHQQQPVLALGIGCSAQHAARLVYAEGIDLDNDATLVRVGVTCRLCERDECPQRAHPSLHEPLRIDPNQRRPSLYMPTRARP